MKYQKRILAVASALVAFNAVLTAQVVNGLVMDQEKYSKEEIVAAVGTPKNIANEGFIYFEYWNDTPQQSAIPIGEKVEQLPDNDEVDCFGFDIVGDNEYVFRNYIIQTGRYSVYGIRVGDNISKVKAMGGMFKDVRDDDGGGCMYWAPSAKEGTVVNWDWICCPKFYYDPDGTINCLELWYS